MDETIAVEETTRDVEIVVPTAEQLSSEEIRDVVGAKNVMGTCSG